MKRTFGLITAALLALALIVMVPKSALADAEGACGENVSYYYDATTKVLTLTGEGPTNDYTQNGNTRSPFYLNNTIKNNCVKIVVGEGITRVGNFLFFYLTKVTEAELPSTLESIGNGAFQTCTLMASCSIPAGVTSIGEAAFNACRALASVTIPAGVTELPKNCFNNCIALTAINVPGNVRTVGQNAFGACTAATEITLAEGVETVGITAFSSSQITSVNIPASLTSLSPDAFNGSATFAAFTVDPENPNYTAVSGVLYNKDRTTLLKCPGGKTGSCLIAVGCTAIADNAFENCMSLTGAGIPGTVTSIGANAFQSSGITAITVPESVTELGNGAFQSCQALVTAVINANIEALPNYLINGCPELISVVLGPSIHAYGVGDFSYCTSLASVTIPEGITEIPESCFYGCSALASFPLPATVTSLGQNAFSGCTALTGVTLPENLVSIGTSAFSDCSGITEITIPDSVTTIGGSAFARTGISTITLPAGVTRLEGNMFSGCQSLTEVILLGEINYVGGSVFSNCQALTAVYFNCPPMSQSNVGWGPFSNAPNAVIHYPNAYPDWPVVKPFDKNNYVGTYVEDQVAAKVEYVYTQLRARAGEDNKQDLRFVFRLTPKDGVTVNRRNVSLNMPEAELSFTLRSYKNFAGDVDGSIIFTAVLAGVEESMFGYEVTAQAFLTMSGDWEGTGYSLPATVSVNDLWNVD